VCVWQGGNKSGGLIRDAIDDYIYQTWLDCGSRTACGSVEPLIKLTDKNTH
jgi:hypothetical protein